MSDDDLAALKAALGLDEDATTYRVIREAAWYRVKYEGLKERVRALEDQLLMQQRLLEPR